MKEKEIITYKGFGSDMKCFGEFQYEEGKEYETDEVVKCCISGFHSCIYPLDVLEYYPPYTYTYQRTKYFQTIASGEIDSNPNSSDTKIASSKIKLDKYPLSFAELAQAAVDYIHSKIKYTNSERSIYKYKKSVSGKSIKINTKDRSEACNRARASILANISNKSTVDVEGMNSIAASTGDCSISTTHDMGSVAVNTSPRSVSISNEYDSAAVNTNRYSISSSKSPNSAAINTRSASVSITNGNRGSVAVCTNYCSVSESNDTSGVAVCTNNYSASLVNDFNSVAVNTGTGGEIETTRECSIAASTGNNKLITNGDKSIAANTTNTAIGSTIICNGNLNVAVSTNENSEIILKKSGSIGVCTAGNSWVMGVKGCYFLTQSNKINGNHEAKLFLVDGRNIKENIWYHITEDGFLEEDPEYEPDHKE